VSCSSIDIESRRADTAPIALVAVWYNLMRHPECYARLRKEIDDTFPNGEEPSNQAKLSGMPYLNACMLVHFCLIRVCD
jgi:Cytochrome P450